jgi:uncharacterized caspase-like protein
MTETESKWAERVKEWKASGQTAKAFAQGRDFKASTLTYWAYRVRRIGGRPVAPATRQEPATGLATTPQVRMVRVRPTRVRRKSRTAVGARSTGATMVIAIGAARIEVRSDFDRALLAQVVEAIGGAS